MSLTLRSTKGSPLTHAEMDSNLSYLEQMAEAGLLLQTQAQSGVSISFQVPAIYNLPDAPGTGDITADLTDSRIGIVQKIYHEDQIAPVFPATWVKLGDVEYQEGQLNVIFAEWVAGERVEYWIVNYE